MLAAHHCQLRWFSFLAAITICLGANANETHNVNLRIVAQSDDVAPSGLGVNLSNFRLDRIVDTTINDQGDVAYVALTDSFFQNRQRVGVWMDPMQEGASDRYMGIFDFLGAPGTPRQSFVGVSCPILSDAGNALATEHISDINSSSGVWLANPQGVFPVLIPGQQAPGLLSGEQINDAYGVAYTGNDLGLILAHTNQGRSALWRLSQGNLDLVAINRSPVSELPGYQFTGGAPSGKINDSGIVVMRGQVTNGVLSHHALFQINHHGDRNLLVLSDQGGSTVPGAPAGSTFEGIDGFRFNNAGTILLDATFQTAASTLGRGLWLQRPGESFQPIVLTGTLTPSGQERFEWLNATSFNNNLNELDHFGFTATLRRSDGSLIDSSWVGNEDRIQLIAKAGDQVPGFDSGVVFRDTSMPQLNDRNTLFMGARLAGPGITNSNDNVLFYRLPGGDLRLLIREGQFLELSPNDLRQVIDFDSPIAEAGRTAQINNRNETVLTVTFSDMSTAAIVFAIVPEPTSTSLIMISLMTFFLQRKSTTNHF